MPHGIPWCTVRSVVPTASRWPQENYSTRSKGAELLHFTANTRCGMGWAAAKPLSCWHPPACCRVPPHPVPLDTASTFLLSHISEQQFPACFLLHHATAFSLISTHYAIGTCLHTPELSYQTGTTCCWDKFFSFLEISQCSSECGCLLKAWTSECKGLDYICYDLPLLSAVDLFH